MNYNKFPLNSLVKQAKKFIDFNDFSKFYSLDIFHGYYWHLTDNPGFEISSNKGPRDLSSMSNGKTSENGAIMLTSDLTHWDEHYNTHRDSWKRDVKRNYVALFDASEIEPKFLKQVGRGFGNEIYLDSTNAKKLNQRGIYSLKYAKSLDKKFHDIIPQSKEELLKLYKYAHSQKLNEQKIRKLIRETLNSGLKNNLDKQKMVDNLRDKISNELSVSTDLYYHDWPDSGPSLRLATIKSPQDKRNQGLGTKAMEMIIQFADKNVMKIFLTPTDWGSTKGRLINFYKSFGFVPNSGKNKDWHFKESMVRLPKNTNFSSTYT